MGATTTLPPRPPAAQIVVAGNTLDPEATCICEVFPLFATKLQFLDLDLSYNHMGSGGVELLEHTRREYLGAVDVRLSTTNNLSGWGLPHLGGGGSPNGFNGYLEWP